MSTVCLVLMGASVIWWGVMDARTLLRAWDARELPETEWFLPRMAPWACVVAAVTVIAAWGKRSGTKVILSGEVIENGHDGEQEPTEANR